MGACLPRHSARRRPRLAARPPSALPDIRAGGVPPHRPATRVHGGEIVGVTLERGRSRYLRGGARSTARSLSTAGGAVARSRDRAAANSAMADHGAGGEPVGELRLPRRVRAAARRPAAGASSLRTGTRFFGTIRRSRSRGPSSFNQGRRSTAQPLLSGTAPSATPIASAGATRSTTVAAGDGWASKHPTGRDPARGTPQARGARVRSARGLRPDRRGARPAGSPLRGGVQHGVHCSRRRRTGLLRDRARPPERSATFRARFTAGRRARSCRRRATRLRSRRPEHDSG